MPRRKKDAPTATALATPPSVPPTDEPDPILHYLTVVRPLILSGEAAGLEGFDLSVPSDESIAARFAAVARRRKAIETEEEVLKTYLKARFDEIPEEELAAGMTPDGHACRIKRVVVTGRESLSKSRLIELGVTPETIEEATSYGDPYFRLDIEVAKTPA